MINHIVLLALIFSLITGGFAPAGGEEGPYKDPYGGRKPGMFQCGEDRRPTPLGRFGR
jgi:hypothetical protein